MNIRTLRPTLLALAISAGLLAGCGGGGVNGIVRAESGDPPLLSPPSPAEACPAPVTGDCTVTVPPDKQEMTGGRQSDYALIKRGEADLTLYSESNTWGGPVVDYRFSAGTTVEAGGLRVASSASLHSNVLVKAGAYLTLGGDLTGDITNHGAVSIWNNVFGNVFNDGVVTPGSSIWGDAVPARVEGDFTQTSAGTLDAVIGATSGGFITVTGRADLDGTLRLVPYGDDWGPYPLPDAPLSVQVLHADGGVFGQFAQWTSPGLFLTGALRYLANDVYFDATAIAAAPTMAAAGVRDQVALSAAGNFDAALGHLGELSRMSGSGFTDAQQRLLASAGVIQRLRDYGQAVRTFDSLSGHGYLGMADTLLQQAAVPSPGLIAHLDDLQAGSRTGAWAAQPATFATGSGAFNTRQAGFDQWLGKGLLVGGSLGWSDGGLRFDRAGGDARDRAPQWDIYVRRDGESAAYVLGDVGYSRHQLDFNRSVDLGVRRQVVRATSSVDIEHAYLEAGRDFRMSGSRLTPFAALSYASLRGDGFAEQGATGFELVAQPSFHQRLDAAAGLRLDRRWTSGSGHWTRLNLGAGLVQLLGTRDHAFAAFTGAPDLEFALAGTPRQRTRGWLQMNLGTGGETWSWLLSYDRQAGAEATSVGMQLRF